jgi:hypothetical protein
VNAGTPTFRRAGTAAALVIVLAGLVLGPATAQATTVPPVWQCRASALWASIAGNNRVEPILANGNPNTAGGASADRPQCASAEAGLGNLPTPLGLPPDLLSAQTASATTAITPDLGNAIDQKLVSSGKIEDLTLQLPPGGSGLVLKVGLAQAQATASCAGGMPKLDGSSLVTNLSVNGQGGSLDQVIQQLSDGLQPLGMLISIKANEQVRDAGSLTQRALHISIINQASQAPVLELVLGEAKVAANGDVCNPAKQPCPAGFGLDSSLKCVPVAGAIQTLEQVVEAARVQSSLNGRNGSTCAHLTMWFVRGHGEAYASRFGTRVVTRGRLVNCKGKSIVGAKIDVVHVIRGHRHLIKTGLKSRPGGLLTLILPMNLTTRSIEYDYRAHLSSRRVTARRTLHLTVRNRQGLVVR